MLNLKKESFLVVCANQPILAFVLLFCVVLAGLMLFSDLFAVSFAPGLRYGLGVLFGFAALLGQRQRYKKLTARQPPSPPPPPAPR